MRVLAIVIALALVPSSLFADPIEFEYATVTFEQPLSVALYAENPESPVFPNLHSFPIVSVAWDVPAFDHTLGLIAGVSLYWDLTVDGVITTDPPNAGVVFPVMFFTTNLSDERMQGAFANVALTPDSPPVRWVIQSHPDSAAIYDDSIRATFDLQIHGPATATYYYIPAAEIPEPTTLLLLGSGLIGAAWKRRRQHT